MPPSGVQREAPEISKFYRSYRCRYTAKAERLPFIGLAELNNPLELVRRADQALYRAKSEGGDRLVRYEPGLHADERGSYPLPAELKIDRML
jgi:hypothetical protein